MDNEMTERLFPLLMELRTAQERAAVMAQVIGQGYFDISEIGSRMHLFRVAEIQFDILQEYIMRSGELVHRLWMLQQEKPEIQPEIVM